MGRVVAASRKKRLTDEQRVPVERVLSMAADGEGGSVKIAAAAGTGKTAVLRSMAAQLCLMGYRSSEILYLAYNRAIKDEAVAKFSRIATVKTLHGMAFQALNVGSNSRKMGNIYPRHVKEILKIGDSVCGGINGWDAARGVLETLKGFQLSSALDVDIRHIPYLVRNLHPRHTVYYEWLVAQARQLFTLISPDRDDTDVPISFDTMLKFWQVVGSPGLERYRVVLLDECQDISGVTLASLDGLNGLLKVFVGDSSQQIYRYRSTIDAFKVVPGDIHSLSQSFRFGHDVADLANQILREKTESPLFEISGNPALTTRIGKVNKALPYAHLFRTNFSLLEEAVRLHDDKAPFSIVGNLSDLSNRIESAWALFTNERKGIRHPLIAMFSNWQALKESAEERVDAEITQTYKIIEELGGRIELLRQLLNGSCSGGDKGALLTTAHRAKGLEFDQVILASDFDQRLMDDSDDMIDPDAWDDEHNLLYVAATRAIKVLELESDYVDNLRLRASGELAEGILA